VHPRPFLKPNWLSPVLRVYWNLSKKQYSMNEKINDLKRIELIFGD